MASGIAPVPACFLRPGRPEDASACGRICYQAFKRISEAHNFPPEIPSADAAVGLMYSILGRPDIYSVVAEWDGRILGSNFLREDTIAAVGPISVDPEAQNGSVGRQLMRDVLEHSRRKGFAGVRLVQAAYHSRSLSLYAKLGFEVREPLALMQGAPLREGVAGRSVRQASERDVDACNRVCFQVHGHSRTAELLKAVQGGTANVAVHQGRVTGYATSIGFPGHAVGESNADLKALIAAAPSFGSPGFLLPVRNGELLRWCLEKGLRVIQPMTLMSLGLYNEPAGAFLPSILS